MGSQGLVHLDSWDQGDRESRRAAFLIAVALKYQLLCQAMYSVFM